MNFSNVKIGKELSKFSGASRLMEDFDGTCLVPVSFIGTDNENLSVYATYKNRADFDSVTETLQNGCKTTFTTSPSGGAHSYTLLVQMNNEDKTTDKRWIAYGSSIESLKKEFLHTDYFYNESEAKGLDVPFLELKDAMTIEGKISEQRFMLVHIIKKGNKMTFTPTKKVETTEGTTSNTDTTEPIKEKKKKKAK